MTNRLLSLLAVGAACLACAPKNLPGTEIKDSPDTRAIAALLETYRQAMERRDAQAVLELAALDYFDNSGTPEPNDDVDRAGLATRLDELSQISDLRFQLALRTVEITGPGEARADVFFDQFYRVQTPNGPVARRDSDVHRMTFKKEGKAWRFTSGL
ncbi:MAG TPA: hypothetical protein VEB43_18380 [Anaeromyxobacter sp.]|nr:hypothetical protein [Anaeromyxobacter sp.]